MKKVLVIGSNSFSGSDFIDHLLELGGYEVMGISRSKEKSSLFLSYKRHQNKNFTFKQMDLNKDMGQILKLLDEFKPEWIANFAAQSEVAPSWEHPEHWFLTNTVALALLVNYLKDKKWLKRYLHVSSPEVYGTCEGTVYEEAPLNPSTPYAASKAAADLLLFAYFKNFQFPLVVVRSTNVYGPTQQLWKIIPRAIISIKKGALISLHGGGQAVKSYIHIRDISEGERLILERGKLGLIYHLSPDKGVAVKEVVQKICKAMKKDFKQCTQAVEERLGQDKAYVIDSTRARKTLGWAPKISLDEGLRQTIDWVEKNWDGISQCSLEYVHQA